MNLDPPRILFLYTELAGYLVSNINTLENKYNAKVLIIHWSKNDEAPFLFEFNESVQHIEKSKETLDEISILISQFNPSIIYVSGWIDKFYRKISKKYRKKGLPVILGMDNPWKNSLKQNIARYVSFFYLKPYFSHVWCSGVRQYEFARRLGFSPEKILLGGYCADIKLFQKNLSDCKQHSETILFAGRFVEWKGVIELYESFKELKKEFPNNWKLLMYGRGPLQKVLINCDGIEIFDFVQPKVLREIMQNVEAFCLPSYEEHWGVAVHEAAAANCLILVSDGVGAGTAFVRNKYNGYVFKSKSKKDLKKALIQLMKTPVKIRQKMRENSETLSMQITPELWAATLLSVNK